MIFTRKSHNKIKRQGFLEKKFYYSTKTYSNPFFRHKSKPISRSARFLSNRFKLIVFALFIAALIFIWLLFFSSLFKITKIEISGVSDNLAKEIESVAREVAGDRLLGKNNLLLYNRSELIEILNEKYFLQNLNINKILFHTLKITLREKQQTAVWREDDKYFYLDGEGSIINQVDPLNINRLIYPVIENLSDVKINGHKVNINQPLINYILDLFYEFKNKKHGLEIEKFILDNEFNTVKMVILAGPKIYFNTKDSAAKQAAALDLIIKERLKDEFINKEYLDLRYGNNIYIK